MGTRLIWCADTASSLCVCSGSLQGISPRWCHAVAVTPLGTGDHSPLLCDPLLELQLFSAQIPHFTYQCFSSVAGSLVLANGILNHRTAWSASFCLRWLAIKSLMETTWFLSKGWILVWVWVGKWIIYEYNEKVLWQLACQPYNCCWIDHRSSLLYLTQHDLAVLYCT